MPHEIGIADLRREAEERGGLLRVEDRRERRLRQRQERLDVLARRVQQLQASGCDEFRRERAAIGNRERIDQDDVVPDGNLDQAELRVVRPLADELRIDCEWLPRSATQRRASRASRGR